MPRTSCQTCFSEIQDFPYAKFQQGYYYHVTPMLRLCNLNITAMLTGGLVVENHTFAI